MRVVLVGLGNAGFNLHLPALAGIPVRLEYGVSGMAWREVGPRRTLLARNPRDPGMVATRYVFEKTLRAFQDGSAPPASGRDGLTLDSPEVRALSSFRMGAPPDKTAFAG